jgi:hypothetical protein
MTGLDIPRQRLLNQRIARPVFERPEQVVHWLGAVQAQDYAGAKWALGMRMRSAVDGDLDRSLMDGAILRTHVLRPTWHFVTPADIRWILALTAPRVQARNAPYYRRLGLDGTLLARSRAALARALQGGQQLTRDELRGALEQAGIPIESGIQSGYILMDAELEGIVCSGGRRGKQFTYALLDERAPNARTLERAEALAELAGRYFLSRGPATVHDFAKWSGLTVANARTGLEAVKNRLQQEVVSGQTYWFPPAHLSANAKAPGAYLLSIYDEYISGYKDRNAIVDERVAANLTALGNDLTYIILVNGRIVGTWKRALKKEAVVIETNLYTALAGVEKEAVAEAARKYGEFHQLPVVLA